MVRFSLAAVVGWLAFAAFAWFVWHDRWHTHLLLMGAVCWTASAYFWYREGQSWR